MLTSRTSMLGGAIALAALFASPVSAQELAAPLAAPAPAVQMPAPQPYQAAAVQTPYTAQAYAPQTQPRYAAEQAYTQSYYQGRGRPPIVGYRTTRQNPPEIWGTGLGLFLAGYVLDFAILTPIANAISVDRAGADEQDAWAWSLVPIAGPIIQLAVGAPHPAVPIATGLMQIGGLITFIIGLTTDEEVRVPVYQGSPEDPNMLQVGLDAGPVEGGGQLRLTLTHL